MTARVRSLKSEVSRALLTSYFGLSLFITPAAVLGQAAAAQDIRVKIVAPEEDGIVSGPTVLRAEVTPPGVAVTVTFYVDGRQVCRAAMAPFECEFDVGQAIAQHQVRAVAMGAGVRVVDTVVTKSLGFAETVDVEIVQVTVSVNDGKGKYVRGLPRSAFRVFEDGQPQTISHFVSEDIPLDLVLAVDVSSSMKEAMPKVKEAVKEFLAALTPRDQVSVLGFNDTIFTLTRKSTDPQQRLKAVERLAPWGATALYDVIIAGADMLGRAPGRKAMLVFSDGEDQGSHASLADAERRLEASDMTLYMIGQGRGTKMESLKKVMNRLSAASGGRALMTEKPEELRGAFADLLQELSNQYLLAYTSTNIRRDGTLRRLRVEVEGYRQIRARDAYRAPSAK
jgi:Ca-activated chloride channel homolog